MNSPRLEQNLKRSSTASQAIERQTYTSPPSAGLRDLEPGNETESKTREMVAKHSPLLREGSPGSEPDQFMSHIRACLVLAVALVMALDKRAPGLKDEPDRFMSHIRCLTTVICTVTVIIQELHSRCSCCLEFVLVITPSRSFHRRNPSHPRVSSQSVR